MKLPTWAECACKWREGMASSLEAFIYNNEPCDGSGGEKWRYDLNLALIEVIDEHNTSLLSRSMGRVLELHYSKSP